LVNKKWLWALLPALVVPALIFSGCTNGGTTLPGLSSDVPSPLTLSVDSQQAGIWVSGEGKVSAVPDIAVLSVGIEAQEESVALAQSEANQAMSSVMAALKDNGVAESDIQTQYFSIRQVTRWDDQRQQETTIGYRVTNMVTAKIRDVEQVGSIIDAVALAGGDFTRIDNIGFSIDDPEPYYEQARAEAIADARAKAEQLASLADVRLGKPTYISEGAIYTPSVYSRAAYDYAVPAPEVVMPTEISPGELEITLNIQVAYDILD
jgi:uncharacterized protein YggE